MKKLSIMAMAAAVMLLSCCNTGSLGSTTSALGGILNGGTVTNVLTSVLGLDNITQAQLVGTWTYLQPGCAFTSQDLLSKAGGEVAATKIKEKLASTYTSLGISSSNTQATFAQDGKCTIKLAGKTISGTYTYDESTHKVTIKGTLLTLNCYAKRSNGNGIALLFEASKLLNYMQALSALSGNTSLQVLGELSKNYDGLRIGFDMQ